MRTNPVFYVGLLKPYRDPAHVDWAALAPKEAQVAEPQTDAATSARSLADRQVVLDQVQAPEHGSASPQGGQHARGALPPGHGLFRRLLGGSWIL